MLGALQRVRLQSSLRWYRQQRSAAAHLVLEGEGDEAQVHFVDLDFEAVFARSQWLVGDVERDHVSLRERHWRGRGDILSAMHSVVTVKRGADLGGLDDDAIDGDLADADKRAIAHAVSRFDAEAVAFVLQAAGDVELTHHEIGDSHARSLPFHANHHTALRMIDLLRLLLVAVLVMHALIHIIWFVASWTPYKLGVVDGPWVLPGEVTMTSFVGRFLGLLALVVMAFLLLGAFALLAQQAWWRDAARWGVILSLLVVVPWWPRIPQRIGLQAVITDVVLMFIIALPFSLDILGTS